MFSPFDQNATVPMQKSDPRSCPTTSIVLFTFTHCVNLINDPYIRYLKKGGKISFKK